MVCAGKNQESGAWTFIVNPNVDMKGSWRPHFKAKHQRPVYCGRMWRPAASPADGLASTHKSANKTTGAWL